MTARSGIPPFRTIRTLAFSAIAGGTALCFAVSAWAPPAGASGNPNANGSASSTAAPSPGSAAAGADQSGTTGQSGTAGQSELQVQAQELAGQIEANGRTLDELDADYNAGQIRLQSLDSQLAALKQGMSHTTALITQARQLLKEQAVLAYLSGGAPLIYLPDQPGQDPSLTIAYAQIIAGGQQRATDTYRSELTAMTRQEAAVKATEAQTASVLASIRTDQARATATLADQKQALAQVKGQMAVLVAQVETAQQHAHAPAAPGSPATGATASPVLTGSDPAPAGVAPASPVNPAGPAPAAQGPLHPVTPAAPTLPPKTSYTQPDRNAPPTTRYVPPPTAAPPRPTTGSPTPSGSAGTAGGGSAVPAQAPGAGSVLAYARAQLGKPYQWAGAGPDTFDCSGLVMMAWAQAGIHFPHLAQSQYAMTARIPLSQAEPGDLIFFGTPDNVYHVGIYIGNGQMIDAPETGQDVSIQSIYWDSLLGAGRVHT